MQQHLLSIIKCTELLAKGFERNLSTRNLAIVTFISIAALSSARSARAATEYWNGTSSTWDTAGNWNPNSDGSGTGAIPSSTTDVTFNNSTANGAETITLGSADFAKGLTFNNTGATTLSGTGSSLTIGSDGITINSGAGAVSINNAATGTGSVTLSASQTWTNDSSNTLVVAGSGGTGVLTDDANSVSPITLLLTGTAGVTARSHFVDSTGGAFTLNIDLATGATVSLSSSSNTYSGGTNLVSGEISTSPFNGGTIGSGTLTMGGAASTVGGSVSGNAELFVNGNSATIANAIATLSGGGTTTIVGNGSGDSYAFTGSVSLGTTLILQGNTNNANTLSFSNTISGAGGITVNSGHPTVILSGTNTYQGTTSVTGGSVTIDARNTSAFGDVSSGASLALSGGVIDLQTDTSINAYNTAITGNVTIDSDKATSGSAGITQTLGTLSIGANTLTTSAGANVSGGTPIVAFGATTLTTAATGGTTTFVPGTAGLTLGSVTGSAGATHTDTLALNGSAGTNAITGTISNGSGTGTLALALGGTGTWTLSGSNSYTGATAVNSGALLITNTSGSALGTGSLTVARGATFGGSGSATGLSHFVLGSGSSGTTQVQVGAGGADTASMLNLAAVGTSTITNSNLNFNLSSTTLHQGNELNLGSTPVTVSSTTLTLNIVGGNIITPGTSYVLLFDSIGFSGLTTNGGSDAGNSTGDVITGGVSIASNSFFGTPTNGYASGFYNGSYLYLTDNGTEIDLMVVPEPSTWALMFGGLGVLILWQRRKRNT